jgi:hypothetical protein
LTPNKRAYKRRRVDENVAKLSLMNGAELERIMTFMNNVIINTDFDRERVSSSMAATFKIRTAWITQESPSINDILEKYPKFKKMPNLVCSNIII